MSLDEQSFGVSFTLFAQLLLNDLTSVFVGNLSSQAKIYIGCPKSCQLEPEYHYVLRHIFNLRKRDCHPLLRTEEEPGGFLIFLLWVPTRVPMSNRRASSECLSYGSP